MTAEAGAPAKTATTAHAAAEAAGEARVRLDRLMVERGLVATRSAAQEAIRRGAVRVGGTAAAKTGLAVPRSAEIMIEGPRGYVSRGALKLIAALDHFGLDPAGRRTLDLGASTGGFTEVLLERGAAHVVAVDVGQGQLAPALAGDRRVTVLEGRNVRTLNAADLPYAPDLVTADLSFISLKLALPPALALAAAGAIGVFLVKPQFEAGREALGKGGIVRDPAVVARVRDDLAGWLGRQPGWRVLGAMASPIAGGDGNAEHLLAAVKDRGEP